MPGRLFNPINNGVAYKTTNAGLRQSSCPASLPVVRTRRKMARIKTIFRPQCLTTAMSPYLTAITSETILKQATPITRIIARYYNGANHLDIAIHIAAGADPALNADIAASHFTLITHQLCSH